MAEKKVKILVAEDDRFLSKVYFTKLTSEGYEVVVASDGEEAIRKAQEENPDIMLLDLVMPKTNGFDVLKSLKADGKKIDFPIIILSNLGQDEDLKKGMDLGADDYLVKTNLSISEVVTKIKGYLKK